VSDLARLSTRRRGGIVIAAITGEIDISNARALERRIADALDPGIAGLVVDLTGLSFLDGSGAHLLYALDDRVNGRFAIVLPASSAPARVLALSGPRPAHWMHRSEAEAVAAVLQL
jgi:anti-anti-sigma factor